MIINAVFNGVEGFDLFINDTLIVEGSNDVPFSGYYVDFRVEVQDGWKIEENFTASITFETDDGAGGKTPVVYEVKYSDSEWNEEKTVHIGDVYAPSFMILANTTFTFTNFIATKVGSSEPIEIVNLIASIYNPTSEQLFQFSQDRYKVVGAGEIGSIIEVIDMGNYISQLYVIPFDLSSIRGTENPVVIGGDILDVSMCELTENFLTVEMGSIEVVPKYENAYDYLNTVCYIVLPFTSKKELDVARIMGKIVTVTYIINLFTGEATCNISVDDELIESFTIEIVDRIPFKHSENQVIGFTSTNKVYNNIENPYIEIVRNIPYNNMGEYGYNIVEYTELNEVSGYVEVQKINLIGTATKREKQEIERLLASGVIIK